MDYKYPDTAIIVFCKAPVAGQVKTRLMPYLSAQHAADLHKDLSNGLLSLLSDLHLCPVQLWCSPDSNHPFFTDCTQQYQLSLHVQKGNDLGEKMHHAITEALKIASKVLLVGCDCPALSMKDFEFAINALNTANDVVYAPAEDGGYVMVAMKKAYPALFLDMAWGNENVLNISRERAKQHGLNVIETRQLWDIDTYADLQRYRNELKIN